VDPTTAILEDLVIMTTAVNIQLPMVSVRIEVAMMAAVEGPTAAPTTTSAGRERVTVTPTMIVPETWCAGGTTVTETSMERSKSQTTAVNIQLAMARVRTKVAMIRVVVEAMTVVPTTISVVRERATVIPMMTVLET